MKKVRTRFLERKLEISKKRRTYQMRRKTLICIFSSIIIALAAFNGCVYYLHLHGKVFMSDFIPSYKNANFSTVGPLYSSSITFNEDGVPATLYIRGNAWSVIHVASYKESYGRGEMNYKQKSARVAEANCNKREITYLTSASPTMLRTSIMHEVLHAGSCEYEGDAYWQSIDPDENQHVGIYHLSEFLTSFYRDNPSFDTWMNRND